MGTGKSLHLSSATLVCAVFEPALEDDAALSDELCEQAANHSAKPAIRNRMGVLCGITISLEIGMGSMLSRLPHEVQSFKSLAFDRLASTIYTPIPLQIMAAT